MSFKRRIRYKFDNFMANGPKGMFISLFLLSITSILIGSILILTLGKSGDGPKSFWDALWWSLCRATDAGTFVEPEYQPTKMNLSYNLVSLFITFAGILIVSLLIAFINTFFQQKLDTLQKGRSRVFEKDFSLIIGWNDKIFDIVDELISSNKGNKQSVIVILSDRDKVEIDDILSKEIKKTKKTKIITRSGDTSSFDDLTMVNFNLAKSIIILSSTSSTATREEKTTSDAEIIKTILAIIYHPEKLKGEFNIITEIHDEKNIEIIKSFSDNHVTIVNSKDVIAKIMTQTSRQSGLPIIYEELLSFKGCEFNTKKYNNIVGKKFKEIYNKFPFSYPIGVEINNNLIINPDPNTIISEKHKIVILTDDINKCYYDEKYLINYSVIPGLPSPLTVNIKPEKILILGYNERLINTLKEFEEYTVEGSEAIIVFDFLESQENLFSEQLKELKKIKTKILKKEHSDRKVLFSISPFDYDIIFILSRDMETASIKKSDADTIFTLLILREIRSKILTETKTKIVSELLDLKNKQLIQTASENDFIISYKLISMILAQFSEQKSISKIWDELFSEEGCEIYLKSAWKYFNDLPRKLSFYEIMDRVYKRNEIAFGYKLNKYENDKAHNYGIILNPEKDKIIELTEDDCIIVVAEDER